MNCQDVGPAELSQGLSYIAPHASQSLVDCPRHSPSSLGISSHCLCLHTLCSELLQDAASGLFAWTTKQNRASSREQRSGQDTPEEILQSLQVFLIKDWKGGKLEPGCHRCRPQLQPEMLMVAQIAQHAAFAVAAAVCADCPGVSAPAHCS